jgi:metal-responsive CopG/Arc/MetJ family transcriptional regulator
MKRKVKKDQMDQQLFVRVSNELVNAIDEWRRVQADLPGRSEAIRRLLVEALARFTARMERKKAKDQD